MKYTVSAYDNWEIPDPHWIDEGTFDSADEAMRRAQAVIDRSLAALYRPGMRADSLLNGYLCGGEVPAIFNEQGLKFDPYVVVFRRIRELTGQPDWRPEDRAAGAARAQ